MFAIDFTSGRTNTTRWRWEDQKDTVLPACSSLVSVLGSDGGDQVVRFTHFSVQQFLTSDRLAKSADLSQFHVSLEPAHAILSHVCLNILLRLDEHADRDSLKADPLLPYVAECWVKHVQFKDVELRTDLQDAMDAFFDTANPHFSAWVRIHSLLGVPADSETPMVPWTDPLYFVAYCGFRSLVERMIVKDPQLASACSREYDTLLHASIFGGHIGVAELLFAHHADVNAPGTYSVTPLHVASRYGRLDAAKWLLDHGADVNAQRVDGQTALHSAAFRGHLDIVRMLVLEHKADVSVRDVEGCTPLSLALEGSDGGLEVVRFLLLHSNADHVNTRDNGGKTPLHYAAAYGHRKVAQLLIERKAECDARDAEGFTPLRYASDAAELGLMQLLLDHGADPDSRDNSGNTALHQAALAEVARILLKNNAEVNSQNDCGSTPLHLASEEGELEVMSVLLDCGADVQLRDNCGNTPLQIASANGHHEVVQILLDHEVEAADTQSDDGSMPSHFTSEEEGDFDAVCASLDRFAKAQVRDNGGNAGKISSEVVGGDWEQHRIVQLLSA